MRFPAGVPEARKPEKPGLRRGLGFWLFAGFPVAFLGFRIGAQKNNNRFSVFGPCMQLFLFILDPAACYIIIIFGCDVAYAAGCVPEGEQ